jgi:predicted DNA-binding transcriptional regulator YafY
LGTAFDLFVLWWTVGNTIRASAGFNYKRHKGLIEIVTQAQSASRCLDIEYRSFARRETTIRRIAPYHLCYFRTGIHQPAL